MRIIFATTLACAALAANAQVKGQRATSYVLAHGTSTCGEAMQEIEKFGEMAEGPYLTWTQGFISGRNLERSRARSDGMIGDGVSHQTLMAALKKKCRDDPFKGVQSAAIEIYDEIAAMRRTK